MLLPGILPDQVDECYLGVYINTIEWVELPNTQGMAIFSDGGWIATKPYATVTHYLNKMSNCCKGCYYNLKEKVGVNACPLNSFYWNFINSNYDKFSSNHRMISPIRNWDKMEEIKKV